MMTRLYSIAFLMSFLLLCGSTQTYAQVDDYAKEKSKRAERRAKNKGDQEVNKSIDKEIDKAFQKLKDAFKTTPSDDSNESKTEENSTTSDEHTTPSDENSFDFSGFSSVELDKTYHFVKSYHYDIEMDENGKKTDYTYNLEVPDTDDINYMAMETAQSGAEGTIIFDHEIESMVVLSGNNSGTIMKFAAVREVAAAHAEDDITDFTFQPTGKTGTHLGYNYAEYEFQSEDNEGTAWISKDEQVNLFKLFVQTSQKMQARSKKNMPALSQFEHMDGLIIRTEMTDKKEGTTTTMELKDVKKIDKLIDTSGYQLMDLSAFMR